MLHCTVMDLRGNWRRRASRFHPAEGQNQTYLKAEVVMLQLVTCQFPTAALQAAVAPPRSRQHRLQRLHCNQWQQKQGADRRKLLP